jgi:hypothetical protein
VDQGNAEEQDDERDELDPRVDPKEHSGPVAAWVGGLGIHGPAHNLGAVA